MIGLKKSDVSLQCVCFCNECNWIGTFWICAVCPVSIVVLYRDSQVQLRFCLLETSCEQQDKFPSGISVRVNNKPAQLPVCTCFYLCDAMLAWLLAVVECPSVCPSIHLSVTCRYCVKQLIVGSCKECRTLAQDSRFLMPRILLIFEWYHPNESTKYTCSG